ncbi:MAG: hypothetical protein NC095_07810 [Muribaculum sp.]|nr:hypothetical protein [Muribaculum sp.]
MITDSVKSRLLQWRDSPEESRDYQEGLRLLADASGNRSFLFSIRDPEKRKDFIEYQLTKYIKLVLSDVQIAEVREMEKKVDEIIKENLSLTEEKEDAGHRGRRDDHESLPDEIKALYVENLDLLRQIREIHLKLRMITADEKQKRRDGYCCVADRHPLLSQIISLDKKMHENWKTYDSFVPSEPIVFD